MATEPIDQGLTAGDEINLYAPRLPDGKENVAGADYGLAIRFYEEKPLGATVIVPALLGQEPNMTVFLNLNGVDKITSEQTESATSATTLYIAHNLLLPDLPNTLNYTARRLDSSEETYEPPITIKYNEIRPGIEDKIKGDEGHSELRLTLPQDVIDDGIDADRAAQGVQAYCMYPYCRAFDKISLRCNGHVLTHVVHPDEAPSTPTTEPTIIGVWLDKAFFEAAGDNPQAAFDFTVEDELTNGADPTSPWSKPIRLVIDLKGARMAAPDIAEDPDDPDDEPDTIDWNKLGTRDLTIQVHVFAPRWESGDTLRVKYFATPSSGSVVEHVVDAEVTRLPFTHRLMIDNAKVIADSTVKVLYERIRGNEVNAISKIARARVIQKPVIISMKNSFNVELEHRGTVSDNKVMLSGAALTGVVLQVLDGGTVREEVKVGTNYKWESKFISIAEGSHRFTVKEKNGNQFESEPWEIERLGFNIDRTQMKLSGFSVKVDGWPKTGEDSIGNTGVRVPTGGVPPYDYASSDPLTAPVTAQGKVVGLKSGVATIYVTDQEGSTLSYLVAVTNKFKLQISTEKLRADDAIVWMNLLGGFTTYNYTFVADVRRVYIPLIPEIVNACSQNGRFYNYLRTDLSIFGSTGLSTLTSWCLIPI
ncbi:MULTISPECIES: hypothetical protein [Pseudomonas]|uniref:hypothetical protein n=1 Tax=Pseudomonas TaxID=286 RepID=UPI000A1DD2A5|nr:MULTISPECIES: hypothetical protein [Pseudomonas]MCX4216512.1 hypothetical protein [Pseudomonas sp. MCal1]UIN53992.1 hypothetical protein LXN51_24075 [Pseudomonas kribbensis]